MKLTKEILNWDNLTEDDQKFLNSPNLKITYGLNNKGDYFELDNVYDYLRRKNKKSKKERLGKNVG